MKVYEYSSQPLSFILRQEDAIANLWYEENRTMEQFPNVKYCLSSPVLLKNYHHHSLPNNRWVSRQARQGLL